MKHTWLTLLIGLLLWLPASGMTEESSVRALGALTPEEALAYLQETPDVVIVDVATTRWYNTEHMRGALHIPIEELSAEEEAEAYRLLPSGRPILMHCRRGMIVPGAYERVLALRNDIPEIAYIDGAPLFEASNAWLDEHAAQRVGGITPEAALAYLKLCPDVALVEVNAPEWKLATHLDGSLYLPYTEMATRYAEIPEHRPVLLYCGGGIVSQEAYATLCDKRPDIPLLGYIAGPPPVRAYNEWLSTRAEKE